MKSLSSDELDTPATTAARKRILLVEDESIVRRFAKQTLDWLQYSVVEAETGVQALGVWDDAEGKIDLLVTDLVMPDGLSGRALAEKLVAKNPRLQVIYASGYGDNWNGEQFQEGVNFLQKPYSADELAAIVTQRLQNS